MIFAIIASVAGLFATITMKEKPPTPPSASAGDEEVVPFGEVP